MGGNVRHDSNHGEAAVVELTVSLGGKSVRVNIRKVELGEDDLGEGAALGVVSSLCFGRELGAKDHGKDLGLTGEGDKLPGVNGVHF